MILQLVFQTHKGFCSVNIREWGASLYYKFETQESGVRELSALHSVIIQFS